ncbi:hypothetical protein GOP47_0003699 [Adiantum capillus-veneris]|uniref:Uncharacterized protein n=1 Tax=Adiantum capillus-veneris TaxID=13818 RepID=A0A9D4ZP21_ADICA|nr:hypothetical protein GOP47_0003699 [Adiantum capillus-veneris]
MAGHVGRATEDQIAGATSMMELMATREIETASRVTDANWWIERWFGDCIYTTWDTVAFFIGLSSICFWLIAQLPQFISNFIRSAADALSPWFLAQWLAGDTFNFLGCVLTGDQLKTQIITAGYFIFSDIVIVSQYVYYQVRNRKAVDFDESIHKGSAYSNLLKGNLSRDSAFEGLSRQDFQAFKDNLGGISTMPISLQSDVVSEHVVAHKSTLRSSPTNANSSKPSDCMQWNQLPVPQALSDLRQHDGWIYEHRHRLRRLTQEYNLEYGRAFSKRLSVLYNQRKEKHKNGQLREALETTNRTPRKAMLGIAGFFGISTIPKMQTFSSLGKSQYTKGGFELGRRALLGLHSEKSEIGQPSAAYVARHFLSLSWQTYPWTTIGRFLGWGSSAFYLGSRLSQLIKNKQRQSAEGLSLGMVTCAVLANITYGLSIIMRASSWDNLIGKAPWLVGSFGTVFLDFSIFIQAHYYSRHSKGAEPNEYTPLLS